MFLKGILIAILVTTLDQAHKYYMIEILDIANNEYAVTSFFHMVMVWNHGISFGMFQNPGDGKYILIVLALAICGIMLVWLKNSSDKLSMWAIGFIIGGAIGNVIDRLNYGAVADFFYFHYQNFGWPAFNIADIAVFLGAAMICIQSIFFNDEAKPDED
jgi:signal peptidase II